MAITSWSDIVAFQIVVNTVPDKSVGDLCVSSSKNSFFLYVKEEYSQVC